MKLRKGKPYVPSNATALKPPTFLPGDPIVDIGDGATGRVEFARSDGQCCIVWDHSGRREWVHEDTIRFAPGFTPTGRHNATNA